MTCGGVNQYSTASDLDAFIASFVGNAHAEQLFLFDTIDPVRLQLVRGGVIESYVRSGNTKRKRLRRLVRAAWYCLTALRLSFSARVVFPLGTMGYGVKPAYWRACARMHGLDFAFQSSAEFEYRYHVILRKRA
jgi:hypothetical protein